MAKILSISDTVRVIAGSTEAREDMLACAVYSAIMLTLAHGDVSQWRDSEASIKSGRPLQGLWNQSKMYSTLANCKVKKGEPKLFAMPKKANDLYKAVFFACESMPNLKLLDAMSVTEKMAIWPEFPADQDMRDARVTALTTKFIADMTSYADELVIDADIKKQDNADDKILLASKNRIVDVDAAQDMAIVENDERTNSAEAAKAEAAKAEAAKAVQCTIELAKQGLLDVDALRALYAAMFGITEAEAEAEAIARHTTLSEAAKAEAAKAAIAEAADAAKVAKVAAKAEAAKAEAMA